MIRPARYNIRKLDDMILADSFNHDETVKDRVHECALDGQPTKMLIDDNNEAVCIMGLREVYPRTGEVWSVMSKDVGKHKIEIIKKLRSEINEWMYNLDYTRMQVTCEAGMKNAHKWFRLLGFQFEGKLHGYGPNGEDYLMFGRAK